MSVLITATISGNTDAFRKSLADRDADYRRWHDRAVAAGALHHRFGIGDGQVLIVDEWVSEDAFNQFFAQPDLQQFIGEVGGDTSAPPTILVTEAIESPDQF